MHKFVRIRHKMLFRFLFPIIHTASPVLLLLMHIRETARELAIENTRNRQRPGFTTDSVRFNNIKGLL